MNKIIEAEAVTLAKEEMPSHGFVSTQQLAVAKDRSQQVAVSNADSIMNLIADAATNPEMDVAKLEKLMDLQTRLLDRENEQAFDQDYVLMKPHLPIIARRKTNSQTKSKYAPLEDINKEVDPILAKYGFGTSTRIVEQDEKHVSVEAILRHRKGHKISNIITMPLDDRGIAGTVNKTVVHAISSTVTYCKRVAICALLNISTGDDQDGNRPQEPDAPAYITEEQAVQIDLDLKQAGIDRAEFFKWANTRDDKDEPVADARRILVKNFKKVQQVIADRKKENAKKGA